MLDRGFHMIDYYFNSQGYLLEKEIVSLESYVNFIG